MSRRYDGRTTTFSPEGRLYQVEYAMEAISHAGTALGILASDGIVLACEKKITSKLLEPQKKSEKMYMIDEHVACAVAGITADANILINMARLHAQRYRFAYQEPQPVEQLVDRILADEAREDAAPVTPQRQVAVEADETAASGGSTSRPGFLRRMSSRLRS